MNEVKGALAMIALFFGFATLLIASENHPVVAKMNEKPSRGVTGQVEAPITDDTGQEKYQSD